ncbi:hypothetical protein [Sphingobium abikonense]|uniref:hypothetical protein n=1 Tax=Sphingobium abikonense TaxID=86193 RepID=UPI003517E7D0
MTAKIYLTVVEATDDDNEVIVLGPNAQPFIKGDEKDESLACGSCKSVLFQHVSTATMHKRFATRNRLLIRCNCGAYNLVPAQNIP